MNLLSGRKVLIVEDDGGIAELVREALEDIGCSCEMARTGKDALSHISSRRPDLIVLDYSLPDMQADELVACAAMPPFIITTGRGDETTAVRLMRAGARDYLIKSHSFLAELPAVVDRVFREIGTEKGLAEALVVVETRLREKEALLAEKDVLIKEIHHRVKNNLQIISSLLRLQTPREPDEKITGIFLDLQSRIDAMALIHETLYESPDLAKIDFLSYLERLIGNLASVFGTEARSIHIECSGARTGISIDRAVPLGLIASELLTNALKHAFPIGWRGEALLAAKMEKADDGALVLEISDNGIGLGEGRDNTVKREEEDSVSFDNIDDNGCLNIAIWERSSLGLKLVHILVDQLDAKITVSSVDGEKGTLWRVALAGEPA